jgi:hypothetical protein
MSRRIPAAALLSLVLVAPGCLDRTVTVTSEPPGAVVRLNEVEIGRTPVTTAFTWYGNYDVQVRKEGHESLNTSAEISAPIYEYPPLDLAATVLPFRVHTERKLHFVLQPQGPVEGPAEAEIIARARAMRTELP